MKNYKIVFTEAESQLAAGPELDTAKELKNEATLEKKPEEMTPAVDNEDIFPADEHEQEEEVNGIVIKEEAYDLLEKYLSIDESEEVEYLDSLTEEEVDLLESMLDVVSLNESLGTGIGSATRGIGNAAYNAGRGFKNAGSQIKAGWTGTGNGNKTVRTANKTKDNTINAARQNRAEARALSHGMARLKASEQKKAVKDAKLALKNNTDPTKTDELRKNLNDANANKKSRFANWKEVRKDINSKYKAKKQNANVAKDNTIKTQYNKVMAKLSESFSDLDLMHILDESGYEASIENLAILKEGLENGTYVID